MARHRPLKKARTPRRSAEKKTLSPYGPQGQRGIHLIGDIVGEMRSRFDPTQATEVGLDGYIEMFDPHTGHPKNVTLAVQSKTVDAFEGDDRVVRYTCERKDIEYWLDCDLPVLLIVSRPSTREAYWLHVQAFFNDPENEGTTVAYFDRTKSRFTARSFDALLEVGRPSDRSLVRSPIPSMEALFCNLIPLRSYPRTVFVGAATCSTRSEARARLRSTGQYVPRAWLIHEKQFLGFVDPEDGPFREVVDLASVEEHDADQWARSSDPNARHLFAELIKNALRDDLATLQIGYFDKDGVFAFCGDSRAERKQRCRNVNRWSLITVVHHYREKKTDSLVLRHSAMEPRIRYLGGKWFLEITPTYRFTVDGYEKFRFHEIWLGAIKRQEKNKAVLSQIMLWADLLNPADLFDQRRRWLSFETVPSFGINQGVPDDDWLANDEEQRGGDDIGGLDLFAELNA